MAESKLRVNLIGDASSLNRSLQIATARLDAFGRKASQIGKDLSLRLTLPIGLAAGSAIKMAASMEESLNKVRVSFGSSAKDVEAFAKTALDSFGIAESSALDMTALFGDMATGMGVSQKEAADLSIELVSLAGDLASFKDMNIEEITTALSGVFTGETESLKRLGIVMTEVNLEQFRLQQGILRTTKEMTQQEKILLRTQYLLEVTKNAQGDFARTSDSAANQMRKFTETLKMVGADLGNIMLPAFTRIITKVNELLKDFRELDKETQTMIINFGLTAAAIPPLIFVVGQLAEGFAALNRAVIFLTGTKGLAALAGELAAFTAAFALFSEAFHQIVKNVLDPTINRLESLILLMKGLTNRTAYIQGLFNRLPKKGSTPFDALNEDAKKANASLNLLSGGFAMLPFGRLGKATVTAPKSEETALNNMILAAEKADAALDEMLRTDPTLTFALASESAAVEYFGNTISRVAEEVRNPMENINEKVKELSESAVAFLMQVGSSLQTAFAQMLNGEGIIESLGNAIKDLIKKLIASAAAAAVLAAIISSITGTPFSASFKASFGALSGFGGGKPLGTAGTPTGMGNLGISGALGNNINLSVQFRLDGQDLVVAVQRANNQRGNFIG